MLYYFDMTILEGILLGFVQGITEFLPISSSGHLVIFRELFTISTFDAVAFDAIVHLATALAVILYFSKDLWILLQTLLRYMGRLPVDMKNVRLMQGLLIGTVPAGLLGFFLEDIVNSYLQTAAVVAAVLCASAIFFMYTEWRYLKEPRYREFTLRTALLIGCFQAVALIPGVSRSGATIAGGMLLGMTRHESARFSFLLAIPITLGVGLKKSLDLIGSLDQVEWGALIAGGVIAFVVAMLVIHFFLEFIRRHTLWPFIWYSVVLSALVGYFYFVG